MWILILQRLVLEFLFDFIYAPLWWYTAGIVRAGRFSARMIAAGNAQFAPGVWIAHIFVPMFGQYDWQGRLVSFFVRLVNVCVRSVFLLVCTFLLKNKTGSFTVFTFRSKKVGVFN